MYVCVCNAYRDSELRAVAQKLCPVREKRRTRNWATGPSAGAV